MARLSAQKLTWATTLSALGFLLVGCGSSTEAVETNTSAGAPAPAPTSRAERCIILLNGTKLCGEDAKTWCRGFGGSGDAGTKATCDFILDRPVRKTMNDFMNADECYAELGVAECAQIGFMTPEGRRRSRAEATFRERVKSKVGNELALYIDEARLNGSDVTLMPHPTSDDVLPMATKTERRAICRIVLGMPGVKTARWEWVDSADLSYHEEHCSK